VIPNGSGWSSLFGDRVRCVRETLLDQPTAFWAGLSLAAPFYALFFSWRIALILAIPLCIKIVLLKQVPLKPSPALLPMLFLMLVHLGGLLFSVTPFISQIIKDLILTSILLLFYLFSNKDSLRGFFVALIPLGVVTAALGLIKAALLDRGFLWPGIIGGCDTYPAGSALCVNYNTLALLWLLSALATLQFGNIWWTPLLLAAGALSSSRRFLLLLPILFLLKIFAEKRLRLLSVIFLISSTMAVVLIVSDPQSFERYRFGDKPFKEIHFPNGIRDGLLSSMSDSKIGRSTPAAILSTVSDGSLGFSSRLEFWRYGLDRVGWFPSGWSYQEEFSCAFGQCAEISYPHAPIISEWIIGGAASALAAILFYVAPMWLVFQKGSSWAFGLLVLALPFSFLSGDTIFSQPTYLAVLFVSLSTTRR